jgi:glycosyltransferase involved in cell wall biosynthesis
MKYLCTSHLVDEDFSLVISVRLSGLIDLSAQTRQVLSRRVVHLGPMQASIVFRDESGAEGGTAHPTQDLISSLERNMSVKEVPIERPHASNPLYWYRLGKEASDGSDVIHVQFEYSTFGSLAGIFLGIMYPFFAMGVSVPMVTTFFNLKDRAVNLSEKSVVENAVLLAKSPIDWAIIWKSSYFIPFIKEHERLLHKKGAPPEKVERFPFVAEPNPEFLDQNSCKEEYGVVGKRVITAFGWVRESKGYHHLIDALPELPDDVVFLVAGGTRIDAHEEYVERLKDQAADIGVDDRVIFTGYVPREEHPTVMNATDLMVFPYEDNRPSAALALALSYQLPIGASDSEVFQTCEAEWGCVRTYSTPDELTSTLVTLLTEEGKLAQLRQQTREYSEQVNPESFAERLETTYRELIDET